MNDLTLFYYFRHRT